MFWLYYLSSLIALRVVGVGEYRMVEETRGTCTSCGREAVLGDGLCVRCWDGIPKDGEEALPNYPDPAGPSFVTREVHGQVRVLRSDTQELVQAIDKLLSCLNERQRAILIARFGLGSTKIRTLANLGTEFDVTRERIRQLEVGALRKLRWQVYQGTHRQLITYLDGDELFTPGGMFLRAVVSTGRTRGGARIEKVHSV